MSAGAGLQPKPGCQKVFYKVQASSALGLKFQWKQRQIIAAVSKVGGFPQQARPREACCKRPEWRRRGEGVGRKRKKRWEEDREKGKGEREEKKQWYVCEREHTKGREVIKRGKGDGKIRGVVF